MNNSSLIYHRVPPFEIAAQTHVGRKRYGRQNEDNIAVWIPNEPHFDIPLLLVLADGMGGHRGGALASQVVVNTFVGCYQQYVGTKGWSDLLHYCTQVSHYQVHQIGRQHGFVDMGSTLVAALLFPQEIFVVNVGDSRAYLWDGRTLKRISHDHSVVEALIQRGELTPLEARRHPKRGHLTEVLSMKRAQVQPFINRVAWQPQWRLLLCSDGLWGVLAPSILRSALVTYPPRRAVSRLIKLAYAFGGPDNISVIVAQHIGPRPHSNGV